MKIRISNCRVSFAEQLFNAKAFEEGQTPKYGADFIIMPDSKVETQNADGKWSPITMKAAELQVANEAWKGKGQQMLDDFEASKKSFRNGNKRTNKDGDVYDGYEDRWYVTAKSPTRVTLLGRNKEPVSAEDGIIYSGCRVDVTFDLYANTKPKTRGVFAGLTGVRFRADDEAFGGGRKATADDFDDLSDTGDDLG